MVLAFPFVLSEMKQMYLSLFQINLEFSFNSIKISNVKFELIEFKFN